MSRFTVHDLAATIDARAASGGEASYTRKLLDKGSEHCAKKFGEEAVETVIAAIENDRDHLIAESSDLLFHLLVLLKSRGVKLEEAAVALVPRKPKMLPKISCLHLQRVDVYVENVDVARPNGRKLRFAAIETAS